VGPSWLPGPPWTINGQRPAVTAAPCVGQHSAEILSAELGVAADEYQSLAAAGITGTIGDPEDAGGPAPARVSH
jgi:hypothetical protein